MTCKLDSTLIGRDLSLQDNEFVECVVYDVQYFVKNCSDNSNKSVLVFPPVNNYRRFLIHKVAEEQSQDLSTFSIGQGHARRTVVCFKRHVIKKPTVQNENEPVTATMGVDHHHLDGSASNTSLSHETATKRAKAMPAVGIYRPPAARKLEEQLLTTRLPAPSPDKPRSGKTRRPDIQVYVPRAKRLEVNRKCSLGLSSGVSVDSAGCSENKKNQRNSRANRLSAPNFVISAESHNSSLSSSNKRKPEHNKLLPDAGKPEEKPAEAKLASADVHVEKKVKQDDVDMDVVISNTMESAGNTSVTNPEAVSASREDLAANTETRCTANEIESSIPETPSSNVSGEKVPERKFPSDVLIISDPEPGDKEEPLGKKFSSDVLIISDSEPAEKEELSGKKFPSDAEGVVDSQPSNSTKKTPVVEKNAVTSNKQPDQVVETNSKKTEKQKQQVPLNLNPDECTWDMLFDDNGDCLDPRLMEELTSAVGSVTIEKPQSDYRSYQSRVEMMLSGNAEDEFAHVLEIYNFPPEFKTHDLFTVFSPYMKNGFEIKWVDDTHALGVFSSALIAAEVLAADHPFVKTRPLHQATAESRMKARRSAEFLQPYRARPETCAAMARRLVTGALGVRLTTSAEEREAERRLLREARERKRLAARQRDEAWEGTLMSNK